MTPLETDSLPGFASWCALQAVASQRRFDEAFLKSEDGITAQWRIGNFEIRVDLELMVSESSSFGIQVSPINLGYRIARRHTGEAGLRLTLTVDQQPLVPAVQAP